MRRTTAERILFCYMLFLKKFADNTSLSPLNRKRYYAKFEHDRKELLGLIGEKNYVPRADAIRLLDRDYLKEFRPAYKTFWDFEPLFDEFVDKFFEVPFWLTFHPDHPTPADISMISDLIGMIDGILGKSNPNASPNDAHDRIHRKPQKSGAALVQGRLERVGDASPQNRISMVELSLDASQKHGYHIQITSNMPNSLVIWIEKDLGVIFNGDIAIKDFKILSPDSGTGVPCYIFQDRSMKKFVADIGTKTTPNTQYELRIKEANDGSITIPCDNPMPQAAILRLPDPTPDSHRYIIYAPEEPIIVECVAEDAQGIPTRWKFSWMPEKHAWESQVQQPTPSNLATKNDTDKTEMEPEIPPEVFVASQSHADHRTYTLPLSPPEEFDRVFDALHLAPECRRGILAVHSSITSGIIRMIQKAINMDCREKSGILAEARKQNQETELKPESKMPYYRDLFQDSSKVGEIGTYLVRNTYIGQFEHLWEKFATIRAEFQNASEYVRAAFAVSNFVDHEFRARLSRLFKWDLSHVRPQLRGMRRLMESNPAFPDALKLTNKTAEFQNLRTELDKALEPEYAAGRLNRDIITRILNKFQKGHLLHVLVLAAHKIGGLYPKTMAIGNAKYNAQDIEAELAKLQAFCSSKKKDFQTMVQSRLSGLVTPNIGLILSVLKQCHQDHLHYISSLSQKKYGLYHANLKKKAFETLDADHFWTDFVLCGMIPSERYGKSMAKLIGSSGTARLDVEPAFLAIFPLIHLRCIPTINLSTELFSILTAEHAATPPYQSLKNKKAYSPIDLAPLNNQFVIIRPGTTTQDLLDLYLRKKRPIPLRFAPNHIMDFLKGSASKKITEQEFHDIIMGILARKQYPKPVIARILETISFQTVQDISIRTHSDRIAKLSPIARLLLHPSLEINIFSNKRMTGAQKIREIVQDPNVKLNSLRILPATDVNNAVSCQMTFESQGKAPSFGSATRCMRGIQIGAFRPDLIAGMDINEENEFKIMIAPDWPSSARYIAKNQLEQKLGRSILNEDRDKEFTAYVHNGDRSELVSDKINRLSRALKANLKHLDAIKKHKKRVQGAIGKKRFAVSERAGTFYATVMQAADKYGINAANCMQIMAQIRNPSTKNVHQLQELRTARNDAISKIVNELAFHDPNLAIGLKQQLNGNNEEGKQIYRLQTELARLQTKMNNIRTAIDRKMSELVAMVLCEIHPDKFAYESLQVKHQGLKGNLAAISQYMPDMDAFISKAMEIATLYSQSQGIKLQTRMCAVHPAGTSGPPHIPTGASFKRGKQGWHIVKVPKSYQGASHMLNINTHLLACQKICEKARVL